MKLTESLAVLLLLLAAAACQGQLQGQFSPLPPPVMAIPQPPRVYDPPPVLIPQPPLFVPVQRQTMWVQVRRPLPIANWLFGPVWAEVPIAPQQQLPPPQPQYQSR